MFIAAALCPAERRWSDDEAMTQLPARLQSSLSSDGEAVLSSQPSASARHLSTNAEAAPSVSQSLHGCYHAGPGVWRHRGAAAAATATGSRAALGALCRRAARPGRQRAKVASRGVRGCGGRCRAQRPNSDPDHRGAPDAAVS